MHTMYDDKTVLIVGGGIAGLSAALDLAALNIRSVLVEKEAALGGKAAAYACKAIENCVRCGACMVEERIRQTLSHPLVEVLTESRVRSASRADRFEAVIEKGPASSPRETLQRRFDAVILAAGFKPFDPVDKPYGYRILDNVITNLQLEGMLRHRSLPFRPSDNRLPDRIAFVQCVGSRDARAGNLWCSKVCCASALRMARLIRARRPETEVTVYYIDVQTYGKDFERVYASLKEEITFIRSLPGDVYRTDEDRLRVVHYEAAARQIREELYDLLVLSVGITPTEDLRDLAAMFGLTPARSGFLEATDDETGSGVFTAGTLEGPMSIPEALARGGQAALRAANHLQTTTPRTGR
jgi:heterodisulfide reductase subunit A